MKLIQAATVLLLPFQAALASVTVTVDRNNPNGANLVAKDLVSLSIEYRSLARFTGSIDKPNVYVRNLLDGLKRYTGVYPLIRVGGGSQDKAYFDPNQSEAEVDVDGLPSGQKGDGPGAKVGKAYFDSFKVWSDIKFIPGLNFAFYNADGRKWLKEIVHYSCKALGDRLVMWELGNEVRLYAGKQRDKDTWTIPTFIKQWQDFAATVHQQALDSCKSDRPFYGPSIASGSVSTEGFTLPAAFSQGIDDKPNTPIAQISSHQYMGVSGRAELSRDLLDHAKTVHAVQKHLNLSKVMEKYNLPYTIGEGNSVTGGGDANVSDVFGAALWTADFSLRLAAVGPHISRMHFHQGLANSKKDSLYSAFRPVEQNGNAPVTRPTYYGMLFANRMIGDEAGTKIIEVPLPGTDDKQSMYVTYDSEGPKRIGILNLKAWSGVASERGDDREYIVKLPAPSGTWKAAGERLIGSSSYATEHVTFAAHSYSYRDTNPGMPSLASDAIQQQSKGKVSLNGNTLTVKVPSSEGVVVHLTETGKAKRNTIVARSWSA